MVGLLIFRFTFLRGLLDLLEVGVQICRRLLLLLSVVVPVLLIVIVVVVTLLLLGIVAKLEVFWRKHDDLRATRCLLICFFLSLPLLCAYAEAASNVFSITIPCF